jgi:hypothetical protein
LCYRKRANSCMARGAGCLPRRGCCLLSGDRDRGPGAHHPQRGVSLPPVPLLLLVLVRVLLLLPLVHLVHLVLRRKRSCVRQRKGRRCALRASASLVMLLRWRWR